MIKVKTNKDYLEIESEEVGGCWLRVTTHNEDASIFIFNGIDWDMVGTYKKSELGGLAPIDFKYRCYTQWRNIFETFFMYDISNTTS